MMSLASGQASAQVKQPHVKQSVGVRNNNPGNIRVTGDKWVGAIGDDGTFVKFSKPEYGIRALAHNLKTYQDVHGLDTIGKIITRWAPRNENFTRTYTSFVCHKLGMKPTDKINLSDKEQLFKLVSAIIQFENAEDHPYDDATIKRAIDMK